MSEQKRLFRSKKDCVLGGVCGGLAEYLEIDPVVIRLLTVISVFFTGIGLLVYLFAWAIVPSRPGQAAAKQTVAEPVKPAGRNHALPFSIGVVLVIFGVLVAANELNLIHDLNFSFNIFPWRLFWPLVFIFFGVYLLTSTTSIKEKAEEMRSWAKENRLSKSRTNRQFLGVCAGLAKQLNMDPTIVRLLFAVGSFISFGFGIFIYFLLALVLPDEEVVAKGATADPEDAAGS